MQVILLVTGTHQSGSWPDCLTSGEKSLITAGTPNTTFTFSFGCWRCTSCKKDPVGPWSLRPNGNRTNLIYVTTTRMWLTSVRKSDHENSLGTTRSVGVRPLTC